MTKSPVPPLRKRPPKGEEGERGGQVRSLVKALNILSALAEGEGGLTLTEVAQSQGLPPSTAHRLLTTLQQEGFVRFDGEHALWSVGARAFTVGAAFARDRDPVRIARPIMRRLMEDAGESVNLAVREGGEAIFLAQVECRQMMRAHTTPGTRVPLHCSGVGKALLSALGQEDFDRLISRHGLPQLTERTLTDPEVLRRDLIVSAERGYAIDDEEHAVGLRCAASVIFDEAGEPVAALSLSGPAARISDERLQRMGQMLREAAALVTGDYGGKKSV
ncbi:IclR family transcriptional regulator C-terminal domain-containing protein [Rhodospirillum sp. A1_3_36]|uniref:IclR family transcriptional regulator domain-containing protein n=1 Tax=Rhodospirillum sp. A1_3_36 TaxID=3391666 RepID=UPI0039A414A2